MQQVKSLVHYIDAMSETPVPIQVFRLFTDLAAPEGKCFIGCIRHRAGYTCLPASLVLIHIVPRDKRVENTSSHSRVRACSLSPSPKLQRPSTYLFNCIGSSMLVPHNGGGRGVDARIGSELQPTYREVEGGS